METTHKPNNLFQALLHSAIGNHTWASHLISTSPTSTDSTTSPTEVSLAKALVDLNMGDYSSCIDTLTKPTDTQYHSESLDYARHFLLGKAYFLNSENDKALIELYRAKDQAQSSSQESGKWREEALRNVGVLMKKVELESTNQKSVGNVNDSAYMPKIDRKGQVVAPPQTQTQTQQQAKPVGPAIEKKYDWYQNNTHLFISYKVNSPEV